MQMPTRPRREPRLNLGVLVCRVVADDQGHFEMGPDRGFDGSQNAEKPLTPVTGLALRQLLCVASLLGLPCNVVSIVGNAASNAQGFQ